MGAMVDKDSITACNNMSSPRLIKSHLPAQLLPPEVWLKKRKIIYVARNVKDVVVSSFNFVRGLNMWNGSIAEFVDEFINNKIAYTSFWAHIVDFWRMRNEPNIFFVTYEEMKKDLESVVKRLCIFLEINELSKLEMKELLHHLSFDNMKAHQYTNLTGLLKQSYEINENFDFMRRGIVGSFKDELSDDHRKKLDKWTNDILQQYGIKESDIFGDF
ncbi:sulfotransferase 1C1-like isoform X2 [Scaptodrosophila lebanonensis]|nr:sulfotransferase 1C1-like isoform X2 [Scaptodrosophila lebanonensis]